MLSAAFTIVMNDMVILKLWISYYAKQFDHLHILCNGTKEKYTPILEELAQQYDLTWERTTTLLQNSEATLGLVKETQRKLLEKYDWVLYADCDEIVVADPAKYENIKAFISQYDAIRCVAYEVVQRKKEKAIDYSQPYFQQRKYWVKCPDYNKTLLARRLLNWVPGCHKEEGIDDNVVKREKGSGLFLLHLKHSDLNPMGDRDFGPVRTSPSGHVQKGAESPKRIPKKFKNII